MEQLFPDLCEITINPISYFTFFLPVSALQIDNPMVVEISVDYGYSQDGKQIIANAWAREKDSVVKGFITTVQIAVGNDEHESIFNELNKDSDFDSNLRAYIDWILKH